jgi:glycosyltransferase involved in cell wall biosynthesis
MNILIIDDKVPDPSFCAGFPRAYRLLLSLISNGHKVYFFPTLKDTLKSLDLESLEKHGIFVCQNLEDLKNSIDVTILSRPHNVHYYLPQVRKHLPASKTVYDTEALWYRRYDLQLAMTGKLPGWAYRYDEIGMAKAVDLCFVVNAEEKGILEENGVQKVVILGHALEVQDEGLPHAMREGVLVVGGILEEDSSNEDGLWHYLQCAWDEVHKKTGAKLTVTGRATSPRLINADIPSMELVGLVPDLYPYYQSQRIFVASTRFCTGIPWKCHEAMAAGIPNVISPLLAHQLKATDGVDVMVGNDPKEYVEKSIALYEDASLWTKIRKGGFDLIRRDCNVDNFKKILQASLDGLFQ